MISKIVKWFSNPETKAKKRTLLVLLVAIAGGLKASVPMLTLACEGVENVVCKVNISALAGTIEQLIGLINTPEIGGVAFLTGLYAIVSGFNKDTK